MGEGYKPMNLLSQYLSPAFLSCHAMGEEWNELDGAEDVWLINLLRNVPFKIRLKMGYCLNIMVSDMPCASKI